MRTQTGNRLVEWFNPGARFKVGPCAAELSLAGLEIEWDGPLLGTARLRPTATCHIAAVKICLDEWSVVPRDLGETASELAAVTTGVPFLLVRPRNLQKMFLSEHSEIVLGYDFPLATGQAWERQFELRGPWGRPFASQWRVRLDVAVSGAVERSGYRAVSLRPASPFRRCAQILGEVTGTDVTRWELRTAYGDSVGRPIRHLDSSLLDPLMAQDAHSPQPLNPMRVAGVRAFLTPLGDLEHLAERALREWGTGKLWCDVAGVLGGRYVRLEVTYFAGRLHGTVASGYGNHRGVPFDCPADDPFELRRQFQAMFSPHRRS
jgi:hypothetical protein